MGKAPIASVDRCVQLIFDYITHTTQYRGNIGSRQRVNAISDGSGGVPASSAGDRSGLPSVPTPDHQPDVNTYDKHITDNASDE